MRTVIEPSGSLNKVRAFVTYTLRAAARSAAQHRGALSVVALLTASATATAAPAELLEEIVVTGSQLPTTQGQTAVPVITVSAADLAKSGDVSNALEALRKVIPGFEGRSNTGLSNANNNNQQTAGGSQLQLRDLPTLVLINGRRVAISGVAAINGKNFVNVSQIPIAAIDRIEVLPDGASAIYGSDAVGGVVNFILKTDYEGVSVGVRDGQATNYGERSAYATGGLQIGDVNIVSTGSYTHSDPLYQSQREFSSPFLGHVTATTLPGVVSQNQVTYRLNPALSSPSQQNPTGANATATSLAALVANGTYNPTTAGAVSNSFDLSPYQTLLLRQDVASFATTVKAPITDHLEAFGDVTLSQGKSWTQWQPVSSTVSVPAGAPYNPLTTAFPGVVFADLNKPHYFQDTEYTARVTGGLKGEIVQGWNWESALLYSQDDLRQQQANLIYKPNLALAIAGGYNSAGVKTPGGTYSQVYSGYSPSGALVLQPALDPFSTAGDANSASLANLYGGEDIHTVSRLYSWDGKVTGGVVPLPGGKVEVAVGGGVRRESLSGHTDPNARVTDPATGSYFGYDQEWIGGTFANPFDKSRTISSEFAELRVPITGPGWNVPAVRAFDLNAAVRHEHYSDAGNSTVPKFGFRWQPIADQLTLRGDYAKSFLAPTLYSEAGPTDTRTSNGPLAAAFGTANYSGLTFQAEDGNNPNLQPATSISKTIGFVIKPAFVPNLTLTADYSDITLQKFQGGAGFNNIAASVNTLGSASPFFNSLAVGAFPDQGGKDPFTTPGALLAYLTNPATGKGDPTKAANLYMVDFFRNLAQLHEESWTISANYSIPTDSIGTFSLGTNGTLLNSFKFTPGIAGQPTIQNAGTSNTESVFGGTLPKRRFYSTIDWTYTDLELTLANTYVSGVNDIGASGLLAPIPVASYTTFDVRAAYTIHVDKMKLQDLKLAVGVNNLANRMPPSDPRVFTDNNADVSTYSPIGRLVYATLALKF